MKSMTCNQLGGACDKQFRADTFEEIAEMSKRHGTEMFQHGDKAHLSAMEKMKTLMQNPEDMVEWLENRRKEFDSLPEE